MSYDSEVSKAQTESLVASAIAGIMFFFNFISCQPVWIKNHQPPTAWVLRETATVCMQVSNDQVPAVTAAINAWDSAIGKWKHLEPRIGINDACDYTIKEVIPTIFKKENVLATTSTIGGYDIELYTGRYEIDTLTVVLHELGHAFGARHMEGTLMAPQLVYKFYKCPDAPTVAQVALANSVDPSLLSWCNPY